MGTAENILVGLGEILGAPSGSTLPTGPGDPIDAAFVDFGFVSETGVVESQGDVTTNIKIWNGTTVRTVQTEHTLIYKFTFLETNPEVLKAFYGNYDDGAVQIKAGLGTRQCWIIDTKDGLNIVRIVIPDGQVTQRNDVSYINNAAIAYGVEVTCYPDDVGVKAYKWIVDPSAS